MTFEEMQKIADRFGWDMGEFVCSFEGVRMAQCIRQDSWRFTDAGAFRVLVEGDMCFDPHGAARDNFIIHYLRGPSVAVIHSSDPHTAVAQAALAQLEEG